LLVTGGSTNGYVSQLWRNITPDTNRPPAAEATLTSQQFPDQTHLSWAESSDPESGYSETFNLRVGTTPGGGDIVSPESLASGQRLIPEMGNMQLRPHVGLHLPPGTYYWSVQIVDVAFRGGPFAPEQSFTVEGAPQLSIVHTNENIILSWPPTSGWVLQETAKLEAPDWKNSPSGTNNPVTLPLTNSAMFYRLSHP
jgi:hypothetical protein